MLLRNSFNAEDASFADKSMARDLVEFITGAAVRTLERNDIVLLADSIDTKFKFKLKPSTLQELFKM